MSLGFLKVRCYMLQKLEKIYLTYVQSFAQGPQRCLKYCKSAGCGLLNIRNPIKVFGMRKINRNSDLVFFSFVCLG